MAVVEIENARESLRERVVAAGARWSAGQRELVRSIAALDASGEWAVDGAVTCAHWVAGALDVEVCTARDWVRVGRCLAVLPLIDSAFEQNRLSYSKVRALICVATPENEAELCELAEPVAAGRLARVLASWLARHETPAETEQRQRNARCLSWRVRPDGTISGWFRFAPADGAVFIETVDAQVRMRDRFDASADASVPEAQRWPSDAQQRADALVELLADGGASVATEIVLHVRGDGCTLDDGTPVAETVVERLVPEAFLRALIHDANGRPLNASGRHRHPTDRQKRVVKERDRCCRKCGTTEHLQYHHDPPYEQSKHTLVDELWLECRDCHRADHPKRNARRE